MSGTGDPRYDAKWNDSCNFATDTMMDSWPPRLLEEALAADFSSMESHGTSGLAAPYLLRDSLRLSPLREGIR